MDRGGARRGGGGPASGGFRGGRGGGPAPGGFRGGRDGGPAPGGFRGGRGGGRGGSQPGGGQMEELAARMENLGGFSKDQDGKRKVHVLTNHFKMSSSTPIADAEGKDSEFQVHQYQIVFSSPELTIPVRKAILNAAKTELFQTPYLYDGAEVLYCTTKFTDDKIILYPNINIKADGEGVDPTAAPTETQRDKHRVEIRYTKQLQPSEPMCIHIYNLIIKQCMFGIGLLPMGQSFYDSRSVIEYSNLKLQLWPGYTATVKPSERGLLLCVDVVHKVINSEDLNKNIIRMRETHSKLNTKQTFREYLLEHLKGYTVITPYNKLSYRIDDFRMEMNPTSTFNYKGQDITFVEFYKTKYNTKIDCLEQPLIVSNVTQKFKGKSITNEVLLIPELCMLTGLGEEMRNSVSVMKALSKQLHMHPSERVERVKSFMKRMYESPEACEIMDKWGLKFDMELTKCVEAEVLPNETIVFAQSRTFKADDKNDWTRAMRDNKMFISVPLKNWVVVTGERDERLTIDFVNTMKKVAAPLGFQIGSPLLIEKIRDVRTPNYIRTLEDIIVNKLKGQPIQLVFCVLPTFGAELYNSIKKRLSVDAGVPSQCIVSKTLTKNMMSVATKVVIQVNTKLGGEPWTVRLPEELQQNSMAIGFDSAGKIKKTGVIVATLNAEYTRYCSVAFGYSRNSELNEILSENLKRCLQNYERANGRPPSTIVYFRNSVDDGKVTSGEIERDANLTHKILKELTRDEGVKLVYMTLSKGSSTRLMSHTGSCEGGTPLTGRQMVNPPPGTLVDKEIVSQDSYPEFFMVPTVARQGTVRSLHYRIILNTKDIPLDVLEAFTYKLCHLYFNWTGTVNLPCVVQYAGKFCKQATAAMSGNLIHPTLDTVLHFL